MPPPLLSLLRWLVTSLLAAALWLGAPAPATAIDDPALEYFTITTEHFYVHYFSGREALAKRTAYLCEEAHQVLVPLLNWTPADRTHVFVTDRLDVANGSAGVYGRNMMNIFGMPPESDSVLGYYDDWLRILVYHEYVHILHLDTVGGLAPWINAIIGKQINPNQSMPRWFIEGLAVHYESARTGTGRVNSSLFQMWLREAAQSDDLFTLGQITGAPPRWPFGSAPYLYGSFFMSWIASRFGEDIFTRFNHLYGQRIIPYSMNQAMKELCGSTFDELWQEWTAYAQAQALASLVAVRARGETKLEIVTPRAGDHKFPRVRPGHDEVSWLDWDFTEHPAYRGQQVNGGERTELFRIDGAAGPAAWTPDGQKMIFSRFHIVKNVYRYQELEIWDAKRDTRRKLTSFERAREPAVSPDGEQVVYVRVVDGSMELVVRRLDGGRAPGTGRVLVSGQQYAWDDERRWQQIATPVWTPAGDGIVFSWWRSDLRQRDLWLYRLKPAEGQAQLEALMRDEAVDLDPHFGPDGRLYFSSDRTGIFNVWSMELETRRTWQVTNVTSGAFTPQISEDGRWLYVTTYTALGYAIGRVERATLSSVEAAPVGREEPWRRYPAVDSRSWAHGDYEPWRWLKPLTFEPDIALLTSFTGMGASVTGYDPVGRHIYGATLAATTSELDESWRPTIGGFYRWGGWPFVVTLSGAFVEAPRTRGLFAESRNIPFIERQAQGRVALSYPFNTIEDGLSLSASYAVDWRAYGEQPVINPEPGDLTPVMPEHGFFNQLTLGVQYNYLEQFPYSVGINRGVSVGMSASTQASYLGSDYEATTLQWNARGYHPVPFLPRHTVTVGGFGALTRSNFRGRSAFSVGGLGPQDVLSSVIFQTPTGGLPVRGFLPFVQSGQRFFWGNAEWRLPVWDLDQGFSTTPIYLRQLKGRFFVDAGAAYDGFVQDADMLVGAGAEVQLDITLAYYLFGGLRLGWAYGFGPQGIHDIYLRWGGGF